MNCVALPSLESAALLTTRHYCCRNVVEQARHIPLFSLNIHNYDDGNKIVINCVFNKLL